MNPLPLIELLMQNGFISVPFLAFMCWLLWRIDRRSLLMTEDVKSLKTSCGEHENRLDDHDVKIATLDTKVCYLGKSNGANQ